MFDDVMPTMDDTDALGDQIGRLAGSLAVGTHRLLTAIGQFDAAEGWAKQGALTCRQWLSWKIGMGKGEAREKVRVARALRELPRLDAAFGRGEVSYSKVRAVTRVATPENESLLVDIAKYTTGQQLERVCRKFRSVVRQTQTKTVEQAEEARYVRHHWTDDGMLSVSIQLPADEGSRFLSAIDAARSAETAAKPPGEMTKSADAGTQPADAGSEAADAGTQPADAGRKAADGGTQLADAGTKVHAVVASRADGLMTITESFLASGPSPRAGGAPHDVVLHVSAEMLAHGTDGAFIESHDGPVVSAEMARRLTCDASVTTVVRDGAGAVLDVGRKTGTGFVRDGAGAVLDVGRKSRSTVVRDGTGAVLDVGRKTRTVPAAMRRALEVRDGHRCAFPGCDHRRYLDAHHAVHWADGGETKLGSLVLTCRRHHTFLHEHGYQVEVAADGGHRWFDGDGRPVESTPPLRASLGDAELWHHVGTDDDVSAELLTKLGWYEDLDTIGVIDALAEVTMSLHGSGSTTS